MPPQLQCPQQVAAAAAQLDAFASFGASLDGLQAATADKLDAAVLRYKPLATTVDKW